jgi:lipopolysaccharide transport system permease protein
MNYEINSEKKTTLGLKELLQYRELLMMLIYRDFKIKYVQTFLGIFWTVIQPVLTLLIFTLIFGKFIKVNTGGVPYPVFALSGMWAWNYFSYVMGQSGNSIIGAQSLVTKIYFPRLVIPLSKVLFGLFDFGITFIFLVFLMFYYGYMPTASIVYLPVFVIMLVVFAMAIGVWLSALTIRYRDVQYIVPFIIQLGLYVTPVVYPSTLIPAKYLFIYYCNPMAAIIEGFRWSILGQGNMEIKTTIYTGIFVVFLLLTGVFYFRKVEDKIADII